MGCDDHGSSHPETLHEETFLSLGKLLRGTSTFENLPSLLIKLLVETVQPADAGIMYLYDETHKQFVAQASYGYRCDNIQHSLRSREGAPGQCHSLRKPLLLSSVEEIKGQTATMRPENLHCYDRMRQGLPPALSMVAVPMALRGRTFGAILLEHYKQHLPFEETDVSQLETLSGWISLMIDNTQSHLELKQSKRSYRELLGKFITVSEEERKRIAREIHDEINQLLLSVKVNLENMENSLPDDMVEARKVIEVSKSHINQVFDDLHGMVMSLRPPALDDLGLAQALDWYIHSYSEETCFPIAMEVTGLSQRRPAPVVETAFFRIAQEALANVIKHARATSAKVRLSFGKSRLVLLVEDNGIGFDPDAMLRISDNRTNLGLLGMEERAKLCGGSLKIDSAPGHGTRLKVEIQVSSYDWGAY